MINDLFKIKVNHTIENGFDVWDFFPEETKKIEYFKDALLKFTKEWRQKI